MVPTPCCWRAFPIGMLPSAQPEFAPPVGTTLVNRHVSLPWTTASGNRTHFPVGSIRDPSCAGLPWLRAKLAGHGPSDRLRDRSCQRELGQSVGSAPVEHPVDQAYRVSRHAIARGTVTGVESATRHRRREHFLLLLSSAAAVARPGRAARQEAGQRQANIRTRSGPLPPGSPSLLPRRQPDEL